MKKAPKSKRDPDLLDEYDFSLGVRGKYAKRYAEGTNVVMLAPDVERFFLIPSQSTMPCGRWCKSLAGMGNRRNGRRSSRGAQSLLRSLALWQR
jgi:hypothetical protein